MFNKLGIFVETAYKPLASKPENYPIANLLDELINHHINVFGIKGAEYLSMVI